ncbi:hypothetical protein I4U23_029217 [Adineta vaga]|nr:hypothetical protein I4U23_029217 [Adineta vaga]
MYATITYRPQDAAKLQDKFTILQTHFTEISSKKCLHEIPGLISHSFTFPSHLHPETIQVHFKGAPVWIKYGLKKNENTLETFPQNDCSGLLKALSFGYFMSDMNYMDNKRLQNIRRIEWKTNVHEKYMAFAYNAMREVHELKLSPACLDKYFVISPKNARAQHIMILPLVASPRCYMAQTCRKEYYQRKLTFGNIDEACLADTTALYLQFSDKRSFDDCMRFLIYILNLECHIGSITCSQMSGQLQQLDFNALDFWSCYAYQMLLTLGYRIKYQINIDTLRKIFQLSQISRHEQYPNHQGYLKLISIYYRARHNRFFDINEEFDDVQPMPANIVMDKWVYVPRIYLTPYGIYPLPIKPMRGNRILRQQQQFGGGKHFCRVIIRDVDLGQPQQDFMKINEQWFKNLIIGTEQIIIGNRPFKFLLCSNSQLRDRSFWFHAEYNGCGADDIRKWMGDFSKEKCVGSRIARMALSLTGTTETITLLKNQIEPIDDISDGDGRIFTDGVGKISSEALKQTFLAYNAELIEEDYMPCIIQARLNGIKGIFVLAPELNDRGRLVQYRPSQCKFIANHNVLEVVKHSSSGTAFMNRQVIFLLENMRVPKHIFLKLQNKARLKISMSLLANKSAMRTLEQNVRSYDWERMHKAGIQLTKEPFVRSLLLLLAQERLKRLKEKSHVQISLSDGRMLFGAIDETNSLNYGEVFIQLRNLDGHRQILCDRTILVTKNPAHFPGDVRILRAVDCSALHHLQECIVFPAKGARPHPNEISGSDLDGDEYWVCWNEGLVQHATRQYSAANFDSVEKSKHNGEITISVIADFLYKYVTSDALGVLSNRHLACCASRGVNHDDSKQLAENISQAVDFPKTGILPQNPKNIKIDQYPDFMENKHKPSFESESSIGCMYREAKQVWTLHSDWQEKSCEEQSIDINQDFLLEGYKKYIPQTEQDYQYYSSRMNIMLSTYTLNTEYELITGCHSCPEEERKNNDSVETASLEFRYLLQDMRRRFDSEYLSYPEQLNKASAWYYVAYKAGTLLSFGWIMNRLMSDIIKYKQIRQEDHQAWKRIGQAIHTQDFADLIKQLPRGFSFDNEECEDLSEMEILGWQFLKIIELANNHDRTQEEAHKFLVFLHRIALNII